MSNKQKPTVFTQPIRTFYYLSIIVTHFVKDILLYLLQKWYLVILVVSITILPRFVVGFHNTYLTKVDEVGYFMLYWIILGVASSIGLGTGLHTFVLYLGPHIAKITLYSYECNALPLQLPSKYTSERFECPSNPTGVTFLQILMAVQFEAFLWGLGTSLGELPPYYVARAAALANKKAQELDEISDAKHSNHLIDKVKLLIYNQLQKHAFITVFLCASIPNPLFDLAGITCGHFLIPFSIFFTATLLGKAVIKVHIQMLFVILVFSKEHVNSIVSFIENNLPFLQHSLTNMLEKQRAILKDPSSFQEGDKPLAVKLWDYFIISMIVFFLISIINSLVSQYLVNYYF